MIRHAKPRNFTEGGSKRDVGNTFKRLSGLGHLLIIEPVNEFV